MTTWTMKDTLKNKTRSVIILTIILTVVIIKLVNQLLTYEVVLENGITHTYHFSFGIYGMGVAIPAGLLSLFIIKSFVNINKRKAPSVKNDKEFKWFSIYGTISGCIIFYLLYNAASTYASQMEVSHVGEGFIWFSVVVLIPLTIAVISAMLMNKVMIYITNTNGRLMKDIHSGIYDGEFKDSKDKKRVMKLLKKGRVSTVRGGLLLLKVHNFFLIIGFGIVSAFFFILNLFSSGSGGGSVASTNGWHQRQGQLHQERKRLKSEANHRAEQSRKQAEHSKRQFVKQANYNAKYSQSEWNRAVRDESAYQMAKRDADSL